MLNRRNERTSDHVVTGQLQAASMNEEIDIGGAEWGNLASSLVFEMGYWLR
jgi:hypothetical protein